MVTGGPFSAEQIPALDAGILKTGTLDEERIPNLNASKIDQGIFKAEQIPGLPTHTITSGTFDIDRIPPIPAARIVGVLPVPPAPKPPESPPPIILFVDLPTLDAADEVKFEWSKLPDGCVVRLEYEIGWERKKRHVNGRRSGRQLPYGPCEQDHCLYLPFCHR